MGARMGNILENKWAIITYQDAQSAASADSLRALMRRAAWVFARVHDGTTRDCCTDCIDGCKDSDDDNRLRPHGFVATNQTMMIQ